MTRNSPEKLTILFADICHSTVLFDQLGDQKAVDLVMQAMQLTGNIASQNRGTVIGTIGDEVMCTFDTPEDALICANQIHVQMTQSDSMKEHHLAMRVGINSGEVLSLANSVYGDTVNIAARLAQQAKAHQSLVSSATIEFITDDFRSQLRLVGELSLQGKAGMIEVHELLEPESIEEITEVARGIKNTTRSYLMTARYLNRQMRFDPMLIRFLLGRGMECDLIIDHPTISRQHAEFLYRNGRFILRDFSTNGSLIRQENKIERLHRASIELKDSGKIYLGRTLDQHLYCIEFTCIGSR